MARKARSTFTDTEWRKKQAGLCITKFCRKKSVKKRNNCHSCRKRKFALDNPLKYSFMNLRQRAKARGKVFTITYEYYEKLAIESGYDKGKGRFADDLTLDRKKNELGYIPGNIGVCTRRVNSYKMNHHDYKKGKKASPNFDYSSVPFCLFLFAFTGLI